jgi:5-methylcytosine-specific restriction protein A
MPKISYSHPAWKKLRRAVLWARPLCEACNLARSTQVDHVKAHKGDWALFTAESNLQALCHSCHSAKTVRRDGGFGKAPDGKPLPGTNADGTPIDPEHHWN